ncbi:hypothetical protein BVRB_6g135480 [Beta vulgaris subsp. vulgaris]|nr:hypothetical protein BVRB_6g135480 [Beta vulgaris subsp. vulgaris]
MFWYGEVFKNEANGDLVYEGGKGRTFDTYPNLVCWWDLLELAKKCGDYEKVGALYYLVSGRRLVNGLVRIVEDKDVVELGKVTRPPKTVPTKAKTPAVSKTFSKTNAPKVNPVPHIDKSKSKSDSQKTHPQSTRTSFLDAYEWVDPRPEYPLTWDELISDGSDGSDSDDPNFELDNLGKHKSRSVGGEKSIDDDDELTDFDEEDDNLEEQDVQLEDDLELEGFFPTILLSTSYTSPSLSHPNPQPFFKPLLSSSHPLTSHPLTSHIFLLRSLFKPHQRRCRSPPTNVVVVHLPPTSSSFTSQALTNVVFSTFHSLINVVVIHQAISRRSWSSVLVRGRLLCCQTLTNLVGRLLRNNKCQFFLFLF